jgi:hypothetical protein
MNSGCPIQAYWLEVVNELGGQRACFCAMVILLIGLSQMVGDLMHLPALKGLAAATMCSPCPKVFTAHDGYETFSTRFIVEWADRHCKPCSLEITPVVYERIQGPYPRRKIFEAVIVYWPVVAKTPSLQPMFRSVSKYALTGKAPLLSELGINPADRAGPVRIRYVPAPGINIGSHPRVLEVQQ